MKKPCSVTILKSALFRVGGLEKYARRIILAFLEKGWKVRVLTTGEVPSDNELQKKYPSLEIISYNYLFPISFLKILEFDLFCQKHLKKHPTDIVFGLDRNSFQTHIRAGNGVHASYLQRRKKTDGPIKKLTYLLNPLHLVLLHMEKKAFHHPRLQKIFTNSQMVKEEIISRFQVKEEKIQVVHNGVEWEEFSHAFTYWEEEKKELLEKFHINPSVYQFLFIGHNYRRKGLCCLLQSLALLPSQKYHLTVVGRDKNQSKYKKLAKKLKLADQITFIGEASSPTAFYQLCDAIVIPSYYDPFANVTIEALAMGLFVVSSKTNGASEILSTEQGVVIDSLEDPHSFAQALQTAMKRPKTQESATEIRNSIKFRDFSSQISPFTDLCSL